MKRIIMHIDANNTFLSWPAIYYLHYGNKVDIRNTYTVIGDDGKAHHGIVLAKLKNVGLVKIEYVHHTRELYVIKTW